MVMDAATEGQFEALAVASAQGDAAALERFVEQLWPELTAFVRANRSMGPLASDDDHVRDIVTRVMEKLKSRIHLYTHWHRRRPDKSVLDWVRIVAKNTIRDHQRAQLGSRSASNEPSPKRFLNEFASSDGLEERGTRPPFTAAETARELVEFARSRLSAPQLAALSAWLEGATYDEIAASLGLPAVDVQHALAAGLAVLRRHFRPKE